MPDDNYLARMTRPVADARVTSDQAWQTYRHYLHAQEECAGNLGDWYSSFRWIVRIENAQEGATNG